LTVNGAVIINFPATDVGTVTAILSDMQPNNAGTLASAWTSASGADVLHHQDCERVGVGGSTVRFANGSGGSPGSDRARDRAGSVQRRLRTIGRKPSERRPHRSCGEPGVGVRSFFSTFTRCG
jgi:hypothetical protein